MITPTYLFRYPGKHHKETHYSAVQSRKKWHRTEHPYCPLVYLCDNTGMFKYNTLSEKAAGFLNSD